MEKNNWFGKKIHNLFLMRGETAWFLGLPSQYPIGMQFRFVIGYFYDRLLWMLIRIFRVKF